MTFNRHRECAGFFIVSPGLDRVLVVEAGEYLEVPRGYRERNENALSTALRGVWEETGIRLEESDLLTEETYRLGNTVMFIAMSSKKPLTQNSSKNGAAYLPWRTLEDGCDEFLSLAVEWAKSKSFG